jgi:hypothetical protein
MGRTGERLARVKSHVDPDDPHLALESATLPVQD